MIIDFNRLKTFTTVARLGSITKAANTLHLTQQAVSSQINLLEEDLGILLFKRANNEIAEIMLSDYITGFKKEYPEVKFEFVLGEDTQSEEAVLSGKLDLAFVVFSKEVKLLKLVPFRNEEFITVGSSKFIKKQKVDIKKFLDLLDYPIIDFKVECPSLKTWILKNDKKLMKHFENKTATIAANDDRMIKSLVLAGHGIANVRRSLVQNELKKGSLVEILPNSKKNQGRN